MSSTLNPAIETVTDLLRERLPADAVIIDPSAIATASRLWNAQVTARPAVVARCRTAADVQAAVQAARSADVPLSVRGGGHDWAGGAIADGGLMIDLSGMRQVVVEGDEARVAGGATVSDVLDAARPHGLAAAVGTVGSVGFTGLTLGGGYGTLIGLIGLGVDNVLAAEVVLADGRIVTAGPAREPDLFWALRGGGGNFGIVTGLRIRLHPFATVTTGMLAFPWDQARPVLRAWRTLTATSDDALDVMFGAMSTPAGKIVFAVPTWAGDPGRAADQIARVRAFGDPVLEDVGPRALADAVHALDEVFPPGGDYHLGARMLPALTDEAIEAFVEAGEAMPAACALNVHHAHGAATRAKPADTAYPYRDDHLVVEIIGFWTDGDGTAESAWVRDTENRLEPYGLPGGWANLMARDDPHAPDAYGANTERLLTIKAHYDPDGVFTAIPLGPA